MRVPVKRRSPAGGSYNNPGLPTMRLAFGPWGSPCARAARQTPCLHDYRANQTGLHGPGAPPPAMSRTGRHGRGANLPAIGRAELQTAPKTSIASRTVGPPADRPHRCDGPGELCAIAPGEHDPAPRLADRGGPGKATPATFVAAVTGILTPHPRMMITTIRDGIESREPRRAAGERASVLGAACPPGTPASANSGPWLPSRPGDPVTLTRPVASPRVPNPPAEFASLSTVSSPPFPKALFASRSPDWP